MIVFPISDCHGQLPDPTDLPEGAVVFCAGDLCHDFIGTMETVAKLQREWLDTDFKEWLHALPKGATFVATPGNHDFAFQAGLHMDLDLPPSFVCLRDRSTWVEGVGLVQGTPWSHCPQGWAYRLRDEAQLRDIIHYTLPVRPLDVWLVHQPPVGPAGVSIITGAQLGSEEVHKGALRSKARVVICGHIHSAAGVYEPHEKRPYVLINAAICDEGNQRVRDWRELEIGEPYGE